MAIGEGKAALLRSDSDEPLSRRLETVRPLELAQLLRFHSRPARARRRSVC
jgi:hypothetical protein